ncbi:hypothetical protein CLHOM_27870 [Clostridium homopropionicum DSM 5847]|uniref:Lipoprotein n=1 Tax=Clostridium homopropionicum DSM 5847 TaxID=1121318 RepID=A0A0L6Z7S7_9CLOT|nr:hypothetical protein [Clostridium homopropionicum]KOA18848.1 hypothetical protein CLHOM_27870 [Clostridium homopropionicum DSM 5847]SFG90228.1 hypothetical protein SAMN04488501_12235 [Clostridium homopropionicum]
MKKVLLVAALLGAFALTGCGNRQVIDTNWTFTKAKIVIGNETIEVNVKSWRDYQNDTQIQIVADDGTVYLTDKVNVLLIGK